MKRFILAVATAALAVGAQAHPFTDSDCVGLAKAASEMAGHRDGGISKTDLGDLIDLRLVEALSNPKSFIKDRADVDLVHALLDAVYRNPKMTGDEFAQALYNICTPTPTPSKPTKKPAKERHVSRT